MNEILVCGGVGGWWTTVMLCSPDQIEAMLKYQGTLQPVIISCWYLIIYTEAAGALHP